MNRVQHLQQTLPINILSNQDYENCEFVVLDYNSSDKVEEYIKEELYDYIQNKKLVYYKTIEPSYFKRSHSRNLAFKLAKGDLVCNLDADNYTGQGFATYLNSIFNIHKDFFLTGMMFNNSEFSKDVLGRVCLTKNKFNELKGYDERMEGYGFEDIDLYSRLELAGLKRKAIDRKYLTSIKHGNKCRILNEFAHNFLEEVLVSYLTPHATEFIIFYSNFCYNKFTLIDNKRNHCIEGYNENLYSCPSIYKYDFSFKDDKVEEGTWMRSRSGIDIYSEKLEKLKYDNSHTQYIFINGDKKQRFFELKNSDLIDAIIMCFNQIKNRVIMDENQLNNRIVVNEHGYGNGKVYKNFQPESFII